MLTIFRLSFSFIIFSFVKCGLVVNLLFLDDNNNDMNMYALNQSFRVYSLFHFYCKNKKHVNTCPIHFPLLNFV